MTQNVTDPPYKLKSEPAPEPKFCDSVGAERKIFASATLGNKGWYIDMQVQVDRYIGKY